MERIEQFAGLVGYPTMSLQGFLFTRPVPRDELLSLLGRMPARCEELLLLSRDSSETAPGVAGRIHQTIARS